MTDFQVVSWSPIDVITNEKLDAMVANDNWLRDHAFTGQYVGYGVTKDTGIKIATGLRQFTASKSNQQVRDVTFGSFFSTACRPIITTGIVSYSQRMIHATIDGLGSTQHPTNAGFQIHVYVNSESKTKKITRDFYVSWAAIGF